MTRSTASTPASPAATKDTTAAQATSRKTNTMDKIISILGLDAAAPPLFTGSDDLGAYAFPPSADAFEPWACADAQNIAFEDWISAAAAPPPTAIASPLLAAQSAMLAPSLSPALSASSLSAASMQSSPLIASDIALSLASTLQQSAASVATSAASSQQQSAALSFSECAAALFSDPSAALSAPLASPAELYAPAWSGSMSALFQTPVAASAAAAVPVSPEMSGSESRDVSPDASVAVEPRLKSADVDADELRRRRDSEFHASLPPQLALKRRRTSNTKHKEKILAEILGASDPAAASKATAPAIKKPTPDKKLKLAADETAADEPVDATALKRKKNTDAARRSRMRKILRIETLEGRVSELEAENARLADMVAKLEAEKTAMAQRIC